MNCALLDRDKFADPRLDEAHRKHASVRGIAVKRSAGATRKRGDTRRLVAVAVVHNKGREIIVEDREHHVDVKRGQLRYREEVSRSGHVGHPLVERGHKWHLARDV